MRKLVTPGTGLSLLVATPRPSLLGALAPDTVIVKPLGEPPRISFSRAHTGSTARANAADDERRQTRSAASTSAIGEIQLGTIRDYHALAHFHYLAGPPAAHKRVYVIRPHSVEQASRLSAQKRTGPRPVVQDLLDPLVAAVLVVSPPVLHVRGRNLALGDRYAGPDPAAARRRLNREMECISRVVVHPMFRGCGLAVRLVKHALATRTTGYMESLAAMGAVHPMFALAGMRAVEVPTGRHVARLISAAQAVGLSESQLAAVEPVRRKLARGGAAAWFLSAEIDLCLRHTFDPKRLARLADPLAAICRRTARQYVYYVSEEAERVASSRCCLTGV